MKRYILFLVTAFCFASCSQLEEVGTDTAPKGQRVLKVNVSVGQDEQSRAIDPNDENKIHTLYIVTFDSNDKMVGSGAIRIANPAPNVTANINVSTNIGETVKVYAVANTNNSTVFSHIETLQEFKSLVTSIAKPEDLGDGKIALNGDTLRNQGQIMVSDEAADVVIQDETPTVVLTMHNQCAALKVTITPSAGENVLNPVKILGYRLCHVPMSSTLFERTGDTRNVNDTLPSPNGQYGDFDYVPVNSFEPQNFTLYMYENRRGTSETSTTPYTRIEQNAPKHATYLEVDADCRGTRGTYRFYLGDIIGVVDGQNIVNYTHYNVFRHENYHINIELKSVATDDSRFYNHTVPNIGDYLYSDGSWGPLRTPKAESYPIAVIFSNEPSETDKKAGFFHGYAAALASTGAKLAWATSTAIGYNTLVQDYQPSTLSAVKANLEGRTETLKITSMPDFAKDTYPAAWYAINFGTDSVCLTEGIATMTESNISSKGYAAPSGTSGWFLGSIGQFYQLIRNLDKAIQFETDNSWSVSGIKWYLPESAGTNAATISNYFSAAESEWAPTYGLPWASGSYDTWYFSSTEYSTTIAYSLHWGYKGTYLSLDGTFAKTNATDNSNRGVRPFIAF